MYGILLISFIKNLLMPRHQNNWTTNLKKQVHDCSTPGIRKKMVDLKNVEASWISYHLEHQTRSKGKLWDLKRINLSLRLIVCHSESHDSWHESISSWLWQGSTGSAPKLVRWIPHYRSCNIDVTVDATRSCYSRHHKWQWKWHD